MLETLRALRTAADTTPHTIAFATTDASISYAELAARVGGMARRLAGAGPRVAVNVAGIDGIVAELAVAATGRTAVPVPGFFSPHQVGHVIADAGIDCMIAASASRTRAFAPSLTVIPPDAARAPLALPDRPPSRIVYTSGTTGRPKGVRLGAAQIDRTCAALQDASGASNDDRHMSVLPMSTLLETICGICLPIRAGARTLLANDIFDGQPGDDPGARIAARAAMLRPTTTVLTPQVLEAWVCAIEADPGARPASLRFVAVGGAPAGSALLLRAWKAGIPAYEGYGLTECCSVVAMNRPGNQRIGTVGKPLPHVWVSIEDDEIVVRSTSVMDGYVGGPAAATIWRTGDVGSMDADGFLRVHGRKDNIIVLTSGRKVSPEWVEAEITNDRRIAGCMVYADSTQTLAAMIVWSAEGRSWAEHAEPAEIDTCLAKCFRMLPPYARPRRITVVDMAELYGQSARRGRGGAPACAPGSEAGQPTGLVEHGVL